MSEYDLMNQYVELGEKLAYEGDALRDFVKKLFDAERQRRVEVRETEKARREEEKSLIQAQIALKAKEVELEEAKRLNIQQGTANPPDNYSVFKIKLPKFDENVDDIDAYIERFERHAQTHKWEKKTWATNLSSLLTGKALQAYVCLPPDCAEDYDQVKMSILQRYMLTEEGYRQKFRDTFPERCETVSQFTARMTRYFERWIEMTGIEKTYNDLRDLVLREQFLRKSHYDLRVFLKERTPKSLKEMISFTEQYLAAHGGPMWRKTKPNKVTPEGTSSASTLVNPEQTKPFKPNVKSEKRCFLCSRTGHIAKDCRQYSRVRNTPPQKDQNREGKEDKVAACIEGPSTTVTLPSGENVPLVVGSGSIEEGLKTVRGFVEDQEVEVLRDTGCTGVVIKSKFVKPEQMTGDNKRCLLIDRTARICPVARISIRTPYYTGEVEATCMTNAICDLIIGNIQGVVFPDCVLDHDNVPEEFKDDEHFTQQNNPFLNMEVTSVDLGGAAVTRQQLKEKGKKGVRPLKVQSTDGEQHDPVTDVEQEADQSLQGLLKHQESSTGRCRMLKEDGVWYRRCSRNGIDVMQLLVPKNRRAKILTLAHECLLGGHLGVKKTEDRIQSCFYWPGISSDVKRWCRSCDTCQRTIPKGRVAKVPLGKMPLMSRPFQKIAIDLVGPINPASARGNKYILTAVDYATRWPEAVALPDITTERIADALLEMFSRVGFPKEILSDRGSQFTSGLMREVCRLISVKQSFTTPYHPMANGLNEKFNGTLKLMIKKMCQECPTDWDRYIPAALFAYREVPQSSTGFAPFELLYGRTVKGPLSLLKDVWVGKGDQGQVFNTYQYVTDLRNKLEETCKLVQDNLSKAGEVYKHHYDKRARRRYMHVGDKVLVLLPTDSNKLLLNWKGPFEITEVINELDYRVMLGDGKTKIFHVNLLKHYEPRDEVVAVSVIPMEDVGEEQLLRLPEVESRETCNDVNINSDLSTFQQNQLRELVAEYSDIFTDKPGLTHLTKHSIELTDKVPVREKPYPLPFATRTAVEEEVQTMLNQGIIERSNSEYNAPVVLVSKPDGSYRFCVNYKKLNTITRFDNEPMNQPDDILANIAGKKYFSKIDFSRGFWQIPMDDDSKKYTAFTTPSGCYNFTRMPFGLVNSPATYNRMMRRLLSGEKEIDNYVDDVLGHTVDWGEHVSMLNRLFSKIREAGLTIRPSKCFLGYETVSFLGHTIGNGNVQPQDCTIQRILDFPSPVTKKQLRSFLGLVGWYQKFIPNYSSITAGLTNLLQKKQPNKLKWEEDHERAFKELKVRITSKPLLRSPNLNLPFIVQTDASAYAVGAVLMQEFEDGRFPIAFASRKLQPRETRYSVCERECLAIVFAINKFDRYLYGKEFVLCTDHASLEYLQKRKSENSRLLRWALFLQNYAFKIKVIKGEENILSDFLSRM